MKKLFLFTLILSSVWANTQTISKSEAELVGKKYLFQRENRIKNLKYNDIKISSSETISENNTALYYIINFTKNSYIIVSANKNATPILAYSFDTKFEGEMPPAVDFWLKRYKEQINYINKNKIKNTDNLNKWNELLYTDIKSFRDITDTLIPPLINSKWKQETYYNASCPENAAGFDGHCLTGCVATATAQILYYHRFPQSGTGSHTYNCPGYGTITEDFSLANYDYNNMPYEFTNYSDAGALLLYHLGVSFDMTYGPNGSSVWNHSVDNSLKTYFKYCPETQYVYRDSTNLNWDSIVVTNLLANKPLYYAGWADTSFQSGHAFVCDGYDGPDYYHFNFGWGGSYDGWFYTNDITPGSYQFTYCQELIKDIYPDTINYSYYPETCSGTKTIDYPIGSLSDGSGIQKYEPNQECTWIINPTCGKMLDVYFDEFNLENNDTLFIYDGNETENTLLQYYTLGEEPILSWMYNSDIITTVSGETMIKFFSDNTLQGLGWKISYFADFCKFGDIHTDTIGTISDGSKACNYEPNTSCKWSIEPPEAEAIKINFTEFNLDTNNTFDNVRIFKDAPSGANLIAKFTINEPPTEVIVPSGVAIITFTTSPNSSGAGWKLNYKTTKLDDIETITNNEVSVYPNPTTGIVNINYNKIIHNIYVSDISGQTVLTKFIDDNSAKINLSEMEKGVYFIKIDNFTTKIILE